MGSTLMPAHASRSAGDDLTDQAATFSIRAIAHAGLLDPLGQYYGYEAIVPYEGRWVVAFRTSTCYSNERVETCDPNAGSREEPVEDAWIELVVEDDHFVVTDAFGRFTAEQEEVVRSYTEPATIEETHLEFPTVRVDRSRRDDGWDIRAANLWAGPLPARGVWNVCTPVLYGAGDEELWRGRAFAVRARRESMRSGGLFGTGAVDLDEDPERAEVECEAWTQPTWTLAEEPTVEPYARDDVVAVTARLSWEHGHVGGLESKCRVELLRRDGSVIATELVRGPPSPWAGRIRDTTLIARFEVRRPRAASSATVECRARGQL